MHIGGRIFFEITNTCTYVHGATPYILDVLCKESRYPSDQAPMIAKLREFSKNPADHKGWDGWHKLMKKPAKKPPNFPTGLVPHLLRIAAKHRIHVEINDTRSRPDLGYPEHPVNGQVIVDRDYQLAAVDAAVKAGRGVLNMPPRCHALNEPILMFDGSIRLSQDIHVGDVLMGPDSSPRVVHERHEGEADLYEVTPRFGSPFAVTGNHRLVVETCAGNTKLRTEHEVTAHDWLGWSANKKRRSYLKLTGVRFSRCKRLPIAPYHLGVLLGDGGLRGSPEITTSVPAILDAVHELAAAFGRDVTSTSCHKSALTYRMVRKRGDGGRPNPLTQALKHLGLWGCRSAHKFLPEIYKRASRDNRLALLAGLLDTDGHLHGTYYEFVTASARMVVDVAFLGRSLGFNVAYTPRFQKGVTYWRARILGDIATIPMRVPHKQTTRKRTFKTGRISFQVKQVPRGKYVGWTVDKDHRYLTGEFLETGNSGKTRSVCEIQRQLALPTLWVAPTDRIVTQTQNVIEGFMGPNYSYHLVGTKNEEKAAAHQVVVCTNATAIALSDKFLKTREVLIADEFHRWAADSMQKLAKRLDHIYFRFGMTGTFFRSGDDVMALHGVLSTTIYKIDTPFLLDKGYLIPSRVLFVPMPATPQVRGVGQTFSVGHGKHGIHEHAYRNQLVAWAASCLQRAGRKTLILVGTKRQGAAIKKFLEPFVGKSGAGCEFDSVEFVSTDVARPRQQRVLDSFLAGQEVKVLLGTSLLGEGVDLPSVDALVYARGEKAEVSLVQNAFRVCTAVEGKTNSIIVDFADRHHKKLLQHSHQRLDVYYKEPTFDVEILPSVEHLPESLGAGLAPVSVNV